MSTIEQPDTTPAQPVEPAVSTPASPEVVSAAPTAVGEAPVAKPAPRAKAPSSAPAPQAIWATGRRKRAIARVRLLAGTGTILVNRKPYEQYFPREALRLAIRQPLIVTHQLGKQNVLASVEGGGMAGQAGAVCLGIARALLQLDPALRTGLRAAGLLTRDPRERERKKYGQKGARKRFQWTKR
ncbi:MAG: 30S ribosomal protein S9 [Candidatus Omnitrophica bacterium]|nr:30S ribosomal protein S9 [Candidatus Omnitrophota bacterium]